MNTPRILITFLSILAPIAANAMSIIIQFEGVVQRVDDIGGHIEGGAVFVGQSISGTIRFDRDAADQRPDEDELGLYIFSGPSEGMVFRFGGDDVRTNDFSVFTRSRVCGDTPEFNCSPAGQFSDEFYTHAYGGLTDLYGWTPNDMTFGLHSQLMHSLFTDALPTVQELELSNWENASWRLSGPGKDPTSGPPGTLVNGTITSLRIFAAIDIDIKPGDSPECGGVIPVAVLGSESLDVSQIDPSTLSFEGLSVKEKGNGAPSCDVEDINFDGIADYVCQYRNGLTQGTLTGELLDGTPIEGDDAFCVKN